MDIEMGMKLTIAALMLFSAWRLLQSLFGTTGQTQSMPNYKKDALAALGHDKERLQRLYEHKKQTNPPFFRKGNLRIHLQGLVER